MAVLVLFIYTLVHPIVLYLEIKTKSIISNDIRGHIRCEKSGQHLQVMSIFAFKASEVRQVLVAKF